MQEMEMETQVLVTAAKNRPLSESEICKPKSYTAESHPHPTYTNTNCNHEFLVLSKKYIQSLKENF